MSDRPKRHHYLPQTIQRNFLAEDETLLWYYDRKKDKYEQRTPKGLAQIRHLYSYEGVSQEDKYALEKAFSVLENKAAPAFLKLQSGEEINNKERFAIAEFVGMQYFRTPMKLGIISEVMQRVSVFTIKNMRQVVKNMSDNEFGKFIQEYDKQSGKEPSTTTKEEFINAVLKGKITYNGDKNSKLKTLVEIGTDLAIEFSKRKWIVMHTKTGSNFITSDIAVSLVPDGKPDTITGFGPASPGMAVVFPFAKNAALMITSERMPTIIDAEFQDEFLFDANSGLARVSSQLYSSNREALEEIVVRGNLAKTSFKPDFDDKQIESVAQKHFF